MEYEHGDKEADISGWAGDVHPSACPPDMLTALAERAKASIRKYELQSKPKPKCMPPLEAYRQL
ncbi:MAG: hypothetical protein QXF55_03025 [Candidatus Aenigmatarchaeota archaeon]